MGAVHDEDETGHRDADIGGSAEHGGRSSGDRACVPGVPEFDPEALGLADLDELSGLDCLDEGDGPHPPPRETIDVASRAASHDNVPEPSRTLRRQVGVILGEQPHLTIEQLAERARVPLPFAENFWKSMGYPAVDPRAKLFVEQDVEALAGMAGAVAHETVDTYTVTSLLRAQSHTTERLVKWQVDALVEHFARSLKLDDTSARLVLLDHIDSLVDLLRDQVRYSWGRQLVGELTRIDAEFSDSRRSPDAPWRMPLLRGVGFVDMVAYTRRSAELGSHALAELIQKFEFTARDVITAAGARIVKTIGDSVLFVSEDVATIVAVTMDLVEELSIKEDMLPVRAGIAWGGVLSRSGDIFGPTVNLASRLSDAAPPGGVLTDAATADALRATPDGKLYTLVRAPEAELQGLGTVTPIEVRRLPR